MTVAADFIASLHSYERDDQVVRGLVKAMSIYLKTDMVDGQLLAGDELHLVAQTGWPSDALNLVKVLPLDAGTVCARAANFADPLQSWTHLRIRISSRTGKCRNTSDFVASTQRRYCRMEVCSE